MDEFGPYRLEAEVGRGGMGEVYRAFDTRRERVVALKRLRADLADDRAYQERFRRECRLAARLTSPHVVPIHDYGEIDGRLFLDMRLIEGRDLDTELATTGPMPPGRAVTVAAQVADALDCAHRNGLVHRDVKPSNVLLSRGGEQDFAYLADFGIVHNVHARTDLSLTATGSALGTLGYMAPETFAGGRTTAAIDVYALACLLYQLLTGDRPFGGDGASLMYQHMHSPPPRVTAAQPTLTGRMDDVIARGMAKDPGSRFGTAGGLAAAAREALDAPVRHGDVTGPGPLPPAPPTRPVTQRRRIWPVVLLTVLATLAVVAGAGTVAYLALRPTFGTSGSGTPAAGTPAAGTPAVAAAPAPPGTATLRRTFSDIADRGAACRDADPPAATAEAVAGVTAVAAVECTVRSPGTGVTYVQWPTADDAARYVTAVAAGRRSATPTPDWKIDGARQGPYFIGASSRSGYVSTGAYDGRRFTFLVTAPTFDEAERTFLSVIALPGIDRVPAR